MIRIHTYQNDIMTNMVVFFTSLTFQTRLSDVFCVILQQLPNEDMFPTCSFSMDCTDLIDLKVQTNKAWECCLRYFTMFYINEVISESL